MYTLTTFRNVPAFAIGHVRDLRVRWALEEAGQEYDLRLVGFEETSQPAYRREQPFGQVPVLQDGDLTLFESGAMMAHLSESFPVLMPSTKNGRAAVMMWMFAAVGGRFFFLEADQAHVVGLAGFLEGPAHAQVAHVADGEGRNVTERGQGVHGVVSLS